MTQNTKDAGASIHVELLGVAEVLESGDGFWRSCSGCHETEDGHPVGDYPYSDILKCDLGGGCSECGGIGAIWDNTDYGAMADAMDANMIACENAAPQRPAQSAEQCCEGLAPSHECWEECGGTKKRPLPTAPTAEQAEGAIGAGGAQEPVAWEMDWPEYSYDGMGCGLEDRNITDRYDAMKYGWDEALEHVGQILERDGPLFAAPRPREAATVGLTDDVRSALEACAMTYEMNGLGRTADGIRALLTAPQLSQPVEAGDATNAVTIDRRDLFDFVRGGIKSALEDANAGEGMIASWYWQEATERTERVLGNLGVFGVSTKSAVVLDDGRAAFEKAVQSLAFLCRTETRRLDAETLAALDVVEDHLVAMRASVRDEEGELRAASPQPQAQTERALTDEQIIEIANRYLEVLDNGGDWDGAGYLSFFGKRNGPNGLLIAEFARALLTAAQPASGANHD
jgi:hypothetical protein